MNFPFVVFVVVTQKKERKERKENWPYIHTVRKWTRDRKIKLSIHTEEKIIFQLKFNLMPLANIFIFSTPVDAGLVDVMNNFFCTGN